MSLLCMCVHMCVSAHICKCMYTHVLQRGGPRLMSGCLLQLFSTLYKTQELFLKLELVCLASLVQGLPVSFS